NTCAERLSPQGEGKDGNEHGSRGGIATARSSFPFKGKARMGMGSSDAAARPALEPTPPDPPPRGGATSPLPRKRARVQQAPSVRRRVFQPQHSRPGAIPRKPTTGGPTAQPCLRSVSSTE